MRDDDPLESIQVGCVRNQRPSILSGVARSLSRSVSSHIPKPLVVCITLFLSHILSLNGVVFSFKFHLWPTLPEVWIPELPPPRYTPIILLEQLGFIFALMLASVLLSLLLACALNKWVERKLNRSGLSTEQKEEIGEGLHEQYRPMFCTTALVTAGLMGAFFIITKYVPIPSYWVIFSELAFPFTPIIFTMVSVQRACSKAIQQQTRQEAIPLLDVSAGQAWGGAAARGTYGSDYRVSLVLVADVVGSVQQGGLVDNRSVSRAGGMRV